MSYSLSFGERRLCVCTTATGNSVKEMLLPCHVGLVAPIRSGNETDDVVRVLIVSTNADPDVAEYPDTGKVGIITQGGDWHCHRRADAVEHAGPE